MKKNILTVCFLIPLSAFGSLINVSVDHDSLVSSLLNKDTNEFMYHQELMLDENALPFINKRIEDHYNRIKEKIPEETALVLLGDEYGRISSIGSTIKLRKKSISHTGIQDHKHPIYALSSNINVDIDLPANKSSITLVYKKNNRVKYLKTLVIK